MFLSHFNAKLEFLSKFNDQLNIENDSADGASVYYGHIIVFVVTESSSLPLQDFKAPTTVDFLM